MSKSKKTKPEPLTLEQWEIALEYKLAEFRSIDASQFSKAKHHTVVENNFKKIKMILEQLKKEKNESVIPQLHKSLQNLFTHNKTLYSVNNIILKPKPPEYT